MNGLRDGSNERSKFRQSRRRENQIKKADVKVLGIDAGGFNTPSWLAFLKGDNSPF